VALAFAAPPGPSKFDQLGMSAGGVGPRLWVNAHRATAIAGSASQSLVSAPSSQVGIKESNSGRAGSLGAERSSQVRASTLRLRGAGSSTENHKQELLDPTCPAMQRKAPEEFQVQFRTTAGDFTAVFYREWSPHGADRIFNLVRLGFFEGARFYRVVPGWVVQFGVNGDPEINSVYNYLNDVPGAILPNEKVKASNVRGAISFSSAYGEVNGKLTAVNRTSELYINFENNSRLDPMGFAPVGFVDDAGMKVVDLLYSGYGEMQDVCADRNASSNPNRDSNCKGPWEGRLYKEGMQCCLALKNSREFCSIPTAGFGLAGNRYLESEFPKMDLILQAEVLGAEPT